MRANFFINPVTRGYLILGLTVVSMGAARAQAELDANTGDAAAWQHYDWLKPAENQQRQASNGETFHASVGQDVNDPFAVLSSGSLYQEKYGASYSRQLADMLSLNCETSAVVLGDSSQNLSNGQKVGLQFQPNQQLSFKGDVHDIGNEAPIASNSTTTTGAAFSSEGTLSPLNNAVLTLGINSDRTVADIPNGVETQTHAYDLQWKQPLGKLPVSAILKGHYEGSTSTGSTPTSIPSLEQSLMWKPVDNTTIQAGLRQQQYQEYPGVDHQLNEALFADWSQQVMDNVSWHSYAEVLNSKGLLDQAPAAPIATGTNGTPQATNPASTTSPTSSLPISIDDQTLTFSTGPSFRLQKDLSASVEYSNRWDKNPAAGAVGEEQRVSVSLKGTF